MRSSLCIVRLRRLAAFVIQAVTIGLCALTHAQEAAAPVLVAAASDLRFALADLTAAFTKEHPGIVAKPTFGSSGTLFAQIENGAPFDLYLSADIRYPRTLGERGMADEKSFSIYALGHLVVWLQKDSPLQVVDLKSLAEPAIKKVAIANPQVAPYGAAAQAAIKAQGLEAQIGPKLVLGENVAQAAQFVQSGAAEAGIISRSLALAAPMKDAGQLWPVPANQHPPIEQGLILCRNGNNRAGAEELRKFILGPAGQAILLKHGFSLPEANQ